MTPRFDRLAGSIVSRAIDAELAALVWILAEGGLPVHIVTPTPDQAAVLVAGLEQLVRPVRIIAGHALEDALAAMPEEPARLGVVLVVTDDRIGAAHWVRPPIRDGAGHVRPQGPAVLAVWDPRTSTFEHFAWGVVPELAVAIGRKPGDLEQEIEARRDLLAAGLVTG